MKLKYWQIADCGLQGICRLSKQAKKSKYMRLSLPSVSKHAGNQCVHTCTHKQGHAQPCIQVETFRYSMCPHMHPNAGARSTSNKYQHKQTHSHFLVLAGTCRYCSALNTCSLLLIQANINSSLDMNQQLQTQAQLLIRADTCTNMTSLGCVHTHSGLQYVHVHA